MSTIAKKAKAIFLEAVEKHTPDEWPPFLDRVCREDEKLRQRVEGLLQAHQEKDRLFDAELTADLEQRVATVGETIGPYKLVEQIGEGGMGVVYMAEQKEPVRRRVALKIIKPGMDSRQVIARFEAERQALALMDHPNIAKVFDAGSTESGHPYFVMELVNGVPVTEYCDQQHLTPKERLKLFLPVCQAVQHAHQKGIIHRDLKPSNVLVALYDGQPVPKVIDFGVAKATTQALTEKTLHTHFGQIVGTLEYMSPEQAERNQLDIDTRSDIYSLGVLLYELLTGTTPFEKERLRNAGFEEMLRIIREEDPPPPSTRLSTSNTLPSIAANRHVEPSKLRWLVRGDLDWIVMRALEKDRARRYETADGFAADIQRYLDDDAVVACPPSAGYRFRKFARRHRAALATTAVVATALILGTVVSSWQAIRAHRQAVRAQDAELRALQNYWKEQQANQQLRQANRAEAAARVATDRAREFAVEQQKQAEIEQKRAEIARNDATAMVDQYFTTIANNQLLNAPGMQGLRRDLLEEAREHYEKYAEQQLDDPELRGREAMAYFNLGRIAEGNDEFDTAIWYFGLAREIQSRDPELIREHGNTLNALGIAHDRQRRSIEALRWYCRAEVQRRRVVDNRKRQLGSDDQESPNAAEQKLAMVEYESELANVWMNIGLALQKLKPVEIAELPADIRESLMEPSTGEIRGALAYFQRSNEKRRQQLAVLQSLMDQYPATMWRSQDIDLRRDLGKGYFGQALVTVTDPSLATETKQHYHDAIENFQRALLDTPNDMELQFVLAACRRANGESLTRTDSATARSEFQEARRILEPLVYFNAEIPRYRKELERVAIAFRNLAIVQYQANRADLASPLENLESNVEILTRLEQQFPGFNTPRLYESQKLIKRFHSYKLRELRTQLKAKDFDSALAFADELVGAYSDDGRQLNSIAWMLVTEVPEAHRDLRQALRIAERASGLQEHADGATLDTIARIHYELGNLERAIDWQNKAVGHSTEENLEKLTEHLREYEAARRDGQGASVEDQPNQQ